ncbi:putative toxin-antitoxin system toxin component, PIN family [Spirosoma validum]|uniref:Toxin-antitoxin system toxin component, PIN family n=1 Tax=Spirosoma validum TaxID=2771355 RepID=A0A927GFS8_9BACT|nr:putative toxin-antitoxin system toxin component, PIN family [Spirosoma validum]MBD2756116.1 putative toxin-antitoxin system toxin component, PIN family [Spirosoma validum]
MEAPLRLPASTSVVFDTNVLISTFVFSGFAAEVYNHCALFFELYTSEWILSEFDEKMDHKFRYLLEQRKRIISAIRERHIVVAPTNDLPTDSRDPDDNNVLQVALFIKANFLITGDRDLLDLEIIDNTEIVSPRIFFERFMS